MLELYVMSFRASTLKAAAVIIALVIVVAAALWEGGIAKTAADTGSQVQAVTALGSGIDFSSNSNRVAFLKSLGWKTSAEPIEVVEISIPQTFNAVYNNYNSIQKSQGFDLSAYRGVRAKRWTYSISNYPGVKEGVRANLIVYNGELIGGDVSSVDINGFMQGLKSGNVKTGIVNSNADIVAETFKSAAK
ncbi:MAG TPA: DUF4830 domain-containing protein [Ruminiclostridium sp.]|nr:DUF4830 domain-containing protein [Ruminiclostridium sp.]